MGKKIIRNTEERKRKINISTRQKKKLLLAALKEHRGIVSLACEEVGVSRTTYYNYYNKDKKFAEKAAETYNVPLDLAESKLFELIEKENIRAITFYLETKGKIRGYTRKTETDIKVTNNEIKFSFGNEDEEESNDTETKEK